jgi:hypothetical protein
MLPVSIVLYKSSVGDNIPLARALLLLASFGLQFIDASIDDADAGAIFDLQSKLKDNGVYPTIVM